MPELPGQDREAEKNYLIKLGMREFINDLKKFDYKTYLIYALYPNMVIDECRFCGEQIKFLADYYENRNEVVKRKTRNYKKKEQENKQPKPRRNNRANRRRQNPN